MQNIPTPRYRLAICMGWISVYCQMVPQSLFCCSQQNVPKRIHQYPCKSHLFPILTKWHNLVKRCWVACVGVMWALMEKMIPCDCCEFVLNSGLL
jgi:hypothetical protein